MKVSTSTITKVLIDNVQNSYRLDPITVFLEDHGQGRGEITIKCYGESWTAYWGAMGDNTIIEFFCDCDEHYIANKLSSISSSLDDYEKLATIARIEVINHRRKGNMDADEARRLFTETDRLCDADSIRDCNALVQDIFDCNLWELTIPSKPNPDYQYLCRIITTVQEALRSMTKQQAA